MKFPEIATGVLVFKEEKLFLGKTKKWSGLWAIPGGHLEYGEKLVDCVKREVKEETNLDVKEV